jgi:hypothetical protein
MIADERGEKQAYELVPDRLAKANHCRRAYVVDAVQASAVLENEG